MIIREAFKDLIPKLQPEEYELLEASIIAEGCREALIVWNDILIDGHNRKEICDRHNITYSVKEMEFEDEDVATIWILKNQLGRRNISDFVRAELALKLRKVTVTNLSRKDKEETSKIAEVSQGNIHKVKKIIEQGTPEQIQQARSGKRSIHGIYKKIRSKERREEQAQEYRDNPLPEGEFDVIYADPPWKYDFCETKSREIENHYPTMSLEDICDIVVPVVDNSILFLWTTAPMFPNAIKVMEAWDFTYKTNIIWDKEVIGMGYWTRVQHEHLLIGIKGNIQTPAPENRCSSVVKERRTQHSKKPLIMYDMIEKMYPDRRYLELFAREQYSDKWTVWGNEIV